MIKLLKKVFKKITTPKPDGYKCRCGSEAVWMLDYVELPLKSGHTSVLPLRCKTCDGIQFMPSENWELFLAEGPPEIVKEWEEGFADVVRRRWKK